MRKRCEISEFLDSGSRQAKEAVRGEAVGILSFRNLRTFDAGLSVDAFNFRVCRCIHRRRPEYAAHSAEIFFWGFSVRESLELPSFGSHNIVSKGHVVIKKREEKI